MNSEIIEIEHNETWQEEFRNHIMESVNVFIETAESDSDYKEYVLKFINTLKENRGPKASKVASTFVDENNFHIEMTSRRISDYE